jgi:serine protease Do
MTCRPARLVRGPLALSLTVVLVSGLSGALPANSADPLWRDSTGRMAPPEIARLNDFMHRLAEEMKPALVHVQVRRAAEAASDDQPQQGPDENRRAAGSGFIIREDGYIVTNAHVVEGADRIRVKLSTGKRHDAKLIGQDDRVDLALIKIDATGLPVAPLGDSNQLRVGEFVVALGHPFGLEQTVSFGIVSRKGTPIQVASPGFDFIQTDAAVNPGNSGGPLVNMAGEVVGVNTMAARNGTIGFAIPANLVKQLLPQLAEKGRIEWGWLGVSISEVLEEDAVKYGLSEPRGALIRGVRAGEPADQGGLKKDDVVVRIDGTELEGPRDLQRIISTTPAGRTVKLGVLREGKATELSVTVGVYKGLQEKTQEQPPRRPPFGR